MNFNFVSIPRNASQSIHAAFRTQKFMNHKNIGLFPDQSLFSFAVIREPVDRLRSWFIWHKHKYPVQSKNGNMTVYQLPFIEWAEAGFPTHWDGECETLGIEHALCQNEYITVNGKIAVNCLINYDQLQTGIINVCKILKMKPPKLRRYGKAFTVPIPDKVIALAKEKYPDDFELYGCLKSNPVYTDL